ncbi:MAG: hypothetical protein Q8K34_18625, partial [Hydrogenophaga sp.]|nr:hypothetical protein [Hydrogenophaga sp.]
GLANRQHRQAVCAGCLTTTENPENQAVQHAAGQALTQFGATHNLSGISPSLRPVRSLEQGRLSALCATPSMALQNFDGCIQGETQLSKVPRPPSQKTTSPFFRKPAFAGYGTTRHGGFPWWTCVPS